MNKFICHSLHIALAISVISIQHTCLAMHKANKSHTSSHHWKDTYRSKNMKPIDGVSAQELFWNALEVGDFITMHQAVNAGADINEGLYGISPLIEATKNNDATLVKWLIEHSILVNARDTRGTTALMHAAAQGSKPIIKLLVPHANLELQNDAQLNAYDYAVRNVRHPDTAQFFEVCVAKRILMDEELVEFGLSEDDDFYDDIDKPLIFRAAAKGCYVLVKQLLQLGIDPDILGPNEQTPLIAATLNHHSDVVSLLLRYHADPTKIDFFGNNARMYALAAENYTITEMIENAQGNETVTSDQNDLDDSDRSSFTGAWPDLLSDVVRLPDILEN